MRSHLKRVRLLKLREIRLLLLISKGLVEPWLNVLVNCALVSIVQLSIARPLSVLISSIISVSASVSFTVLSTVGLIWHFWVVRVSNVDASSTVRKSKTTGWIHSYARLLFGFKVNKSNFLSVSITSNSHLNKAIEDTKDLVQFVTLEILRYVAYIQTYHIQK